MALDLTVDELLTTTRSVRKRLNFDKPVPRQVLMECLDLALQAPTGSNMQGWRWVFIEDAEKKKAIADIYRSNARRYLAEPLPQFDDVRGERMDRIADSAGYLAEHLEQAPVMLIPCIAGKPETTPHPTAAFWASLHPAVWSFCLALRSRGLGSCWTTLHLLGEGEKRAAEITGIPFERYAQGGLLPIAYTKGTDFRPAKRLPATELTRWNSW
jgi:nitroreductase